MNDIVTHQPVQVPSNPADLTEYYRRAAEAYAATERTFSSTISAKNGTMMLGDQPIPGNQFAAVILDAVRVNTFYTTAYNPNSVDPPVCYAIGRNDAELAPHPDMAKDMSYFRPQADRCSGCPHNQFGSRGQGQGKACSNKRRLYVLLAGTYGMTPMGLQMNPFMDPEHYRETPFYQVSLPPTSLKAWGEYVRGSAAQYQRPMFALVTRVFLYQHPQHGKEAWGFEALGPAPDAWAPIIAERHNTALSEIMQGYEPPQSRHPGGGFYGQQSQAQQHQR